MDTEPTDTTLVKVFIKIRKAISDVTKEYDARIDALRGQQKQVGTEILRRLHERGASQTKTEAGTAFIGENMSITIADETAYGDFVLEQQDYGYYQKRAKVERVKEYMKQHDGTLPPGLTVFRELTINVRAAVPKGRASEQASDDSRSNEHSAE
jgi:hypothetical protein